MLKSVKLSGCQVVRLSSCHVKLSSLILGTCWTTFVFMSMLKIHCLEVKMSMFFFISAAASREFRVHRAGSQLKMSNQLYDWHKSVYFVIDVKYTRIWIVKKVLDPVLWYNSLLLLASRSHVFSSLYCKTGRLVLDTAQGVWSYLTRCSVANNAAFSTQ